MGVSLFKTSVDHTRLQSIFDIQTTYKYLNSIKTRSIVVVIPHWPVSVQRTPLQTINNFSVQERTGKPGDFPMVQYEFIRFDSIIGGLLKIVYNYLSI